MPSPQSCPALRSYYEREGATAEPTAAIAKTAARAARQAEMREAREMAESLVAALEAAELESEQQERCDEWEAFDAVVRHDDSEAKLEEADEE